LALVSSKWRSLGLRLWVFALLALTLLAVQAAGAQSSPINIAYGRSWPLSIVVDAPRGLVYVDATSGIYPPTGFSFGIINATAHALLKVLPLNATPGPMVIDQHMGRLYVAGTTSILVFDLSNQSFTEELAVGRPILYMADGYPASDYIYYTSGNGVYAINQNGATVANATVQGEAGSLALDLANGRLYVGNYLTRSISIFRASDLAPAGSIAVQNCCPSQLALDQSTRMLYATTGTNYVEVVNANTDTFVRSVQLASSGQNSTSAIVADEASGRVFVSSSPGGSIIELDSGGAVLGKFILATEPAALAIDSQTGELYATNYHQVTVFDAREPIPGPNYAPAEEALAGAGLAAVALVIVLWWRRQRTIRPAAQGGQRNLPTGATCTREWAE